MERRPTPDPGASETLRGEPDHAAARRNVQQNAMPENAIPENAIPENEGLTGEGRRSPADAQNAEGSESDEAREAAAQRGRAGS